ncbi:FHA domain-containing protein [Catelliglobosispora koreensis]|uniref:FHA domain-containing protein n=1 Tax=Catelliglobosispora koreensis TaxID=129052 RepID=UPI00035E6015|nr:FHA domain-containing protein [Catelliglobosispora koreensis]
MSWPVPVRPSLGFLLLDDTTTYRLDSDYVIGRDPGELGHSARTIRLFHHTGGISRRHVRISLLGQTVKVTDLGSANGTQLELPGGTEVVSLQPFQPRDISVGTTIRLVRRWIRYEPGALG